MYVVIALDVPPASATSRQQRIRFAWSSASCRIDRQIRGTILGPGIEHRLHDTPRLRGGRLLMIEKRIPLACSFATAAWARVVNTLSSVTNVPSTSAITAEHLNSDGRGLFMTNVRRHRFGRTASVGHFAPTAHPLRLVLGFLPDRSANPRHHSWPRHRAPVARYAKTAPPCRPA